MCALSKITHIEGSKDIHYYMSEIISLDIFPHTTGPSSTQRHGKEHSPEPPDKRPRTDLGRCSDVWYQCSYIYVISCVLYTSLESGFGVILELCALSGVQRRYDSITRSY